jgi:phosphoribosyl 1,2-cyclic phosphodiesterase
MHRLLNPGLGEMSIKLSILASGSKGNSIYVATPRVRVLIDAGLSAREIDRRLKRIGLRAKDLDAVVITHEHRDHVSGLGPLSRRYRLPVFLNRATRRNLPDQVGSLADCIEFNTGRSFSVADLTIHPFSLSHDAADPVGLTLVNGESKVGICTDLGRATRLVEHHLQGCRLLLLEANHDVGMLTKGPYPWSLKQRIKSTSGHLSNDKARELLARVLGDPLQRVILAHLSEVNNRPETALEAFAEVRNACRLHLTVASQHEPSEIIVLP